MKELVIFIPTIIDSLNKVKTNHWTKNHKMNDNATKIINSVLHNHKHNKFNKVKISFQCILGTETGFTGKISKNGKPVKVRNKNARDIINNSPSIKLIEDCIVRSGMLVDDNPDYVVGHTIYPDKVDRNVKGSGMIVKITEVEDDYEDSELIDLFDKEFRKDYTYKKEKKK